MAEAELVFMEEVGPSDCALLVAIPLTREEFLRDVEVATATDLRQARGDYAYRIASSSRDGDAKAAWVTDGLPVAELCHDLINDARQYGLRQVSERADREQFRRALNSGAKVVLLVAHRRGAEMLTRDILVGSGQQLIDNLDHHGSDLGRELACYLAKSQPEGPKAIRRVLNEFIGRAESPDDVRDLIDHACSRHVVPGSCVELRDGYHKDHEIATWIPSDWRGVFDLGVCHSVRLALALKSQRGDRQVITNEAEKEPSRCLREMREAVVRLAVKPSHYASLRGEIFRDYSWILRGKNHAIDQPAAGRD
ncbi:hypothetical protein GOD64_28235 [Sinorhizobium medicae]|nr:hypothetical protein [Sinorhizobium medicae]